MKEKDELYEIYLESTKKEVRSLRIMRAENGFYLFYLRKIRDREDEEARKDEEIREDKKYVECRDIGGVVYFENVERLYNDVPRVIRSIELEVGSRFPEIEADNPIESNLVRWINTRVENARRNNWCWDFLADNPLNFRF